MNPLPRTSWTVLTLAFLLGSPVAAQGEFGSAIELTDGLRSDSVSAPVDLDGDGDLDLVGLDSLKRSVQLFRSTGPGEFAGLEVLFEYDVDVRSVGAPDLDGDGILDLVVHLNDPNAPANARDSLELRRGLGGGAFGPPISLTLPPLFSGPPLYEDLDLDGDLDLAFQARGLYYVELGPGLTPGPPTLASTTQDFSQGFGFVDYDADGDGDWVFIGPFWTINRIENLGALTFGPETAVAPPAFDVEGIEVADFDGDGLEDFAALSRPGASGNAPSIIYRNEGTGLFSKTPLPLVGQARGFAFYDVDADGDLDVVTSIAAQGSAGTVSAWWEFQGAAGWGDAAPFGEVFPGPALRIHVADMDRDGRDDLVQSSASARLQWTRGLASPSGNGLAVEQVNRSISTLVSAPTELVSLDLDVDGDQDVLVLAADGSVVVWTNTGFGELVETSSVDLGGRVPRTLKVVDFNRDGRSDLVIIDEDGAVGWLPGQGGGLGALRVIETFSSAPMAEPLIADINGDGLPELLVATPQFWTNGVELLSYEMLPSGAIDRRTLQNAPWPITFMDVGDVDLDGVDDLFLVTKNQLRSQLRIAPGLGGGFYSAPQVFVTLLDLRGPVQLADTDGDGLLDVHWLSSIGQVQRAVGMGNGAFASGELLRFGALSINHLLLEDINGDGALDALWAARTGSPTQGAVAWAQVGMAGLPEVQGDLIQALPNGCRPVLVDLDGDGDLDVLLASTSSGRMFLAPSLRSEPLGTSYCGPAVPNSTGEPAQLQAAGSRQLVENRLQLRVDRLPPGAIGLFACSRAGGNVPMAGGSQGTLCLGGTLGRLTAPGQVAAATADGTRTLGVDLTSLPQGNGTVSAMVGEVWRFQLWYRDTVGGTATSNFSDGLALRFL